MSDFDQTKFSSPYFEIDTVEVPSIRAGGPSNSSILNRYLRSLQEDLVRMGGELVRLQLQQQYLTEALLTQSAAYSYPWALATAAVTAMAATGDIIWLDGHSVDYVTDQTISSQHSKYGQWTLPVRSEFDLLFTNDIYGEPWVSSEASLRYLEAATGANIEDSEMQVANNTEDLLTAQGIWIQPSSNLTYKWIQLDTPLQYQSLPATCIEFDLMPCYGTTLLQVEVLSSSWTRQDLTYITGYDEVSDSVPMCGPVRLFFDTEDVRAVRLLISTGNTAWGLGTLRLKHLEFMPTGKLQWEFSPSLDKSISFGRLGGKNPEDLNELTQTVEEKKFTVDLTSLDIRTSPVITNAIVKFIV